MNSASGTDRNANAIYLKRQTIKNQEVNLPFAEKIRFQMFNLNARKQFV